ncbi:hypothetical protein F511_30677 [Dorcoceras hygrometricum]|uniref:Uncharacterized protein n=1 Tax=Dorcoceras hygrometricum TaxID=472368 RepID=A0A2Z7BA34_9LAMI|nr:hypothetical protein F511_30677 [Dorcoceras hygrometricum]
MCECAPSLAHIGRPATSPWRHASSIHRTIVPTSVACSGRVERRKGARQLARGGDQRSPEAAHGRALPALALHNNLRPSSPSGRATCWNQISRGFNCGNRCIEIGSFCSHCFVVVALFLPGYEGEWRYRTLISLLGYPAGRGADPARGAPGGGKSVPVLVLPLYSKKPAAGRFLMPTADFAPIVETVSYQHFLLILKTMSHRSLDWIISRYHNLSTDFQLLVWLLNDIVSSLIIISQNAVVYSLNWNNFSLVWFAFNIETTTSYLRHNQPTDASITSRYTSKPADA